MDYIRLEVVLNVSVSVPNLVFYEVVLEEDSSDRFLMDVSSDPGVVNPEDISSKGVLAINVVA